MKALKVCRTSKVVIYLTEKEMAALNAAVEKTGLPRTEVLRKFLLRLI